MPLGDSTDTMARHILDADAKLQVMRQVESAWQLPFLPDPVKADLAMQGGFGAEDLRTLLNELDRQLSPKFDPTRMMTPLVSAPSSFSPMARGLVLPGTPDTTVVRAPFLSPPPAQPIDMNDVGITMFTELAGLPPPTVPDGNAVIRFKQEAIRMGILPPDYPVDGTWTPEMNAVSRELNSRKFQERVAGNRFGGGSLATAIKLADQWLSPTALFGAAVNMGFLPDVGHIAKEGAEWFSNDRWNREVAEQTTVLGKVKGFLGFVLGPVDDVVLPVVNLLSLATGVGEVYAFSRVPALAAAGNIGKATRVGEGFLGTTRAMKGATTLSHLSRPRRVMAGLNPLNYRLFNPAYAFADEAGQAALRAQWMGREGTVLSRLKAAPLRESAIMPGAQAAWGDQIVRWRRAENVLRARKVNQMVMRQGQIALMESYLFPNRAESQAVQAVSATRMGGEAPMGLWAGDTVLDLLFSPRAIMPDGFYKHAASPVARAWRGWVDSEKWAETGVAWTIARALDALHTVQGGAERSLDGWMKGGPAELFKRLGLNNDQAVAVMGEISANAWAHKIATEAATAAVGPRPGAFSRGFDAANMTAYTNSRRRSLFLLRTWDPAQPFTAAEYIRESRYFDSAEAKRWKHWMDSQDAFAPMAANGYTKKELVDFAAEHNLLPPKFNSKTTKAALEKHIGDFFAEGHSELQTVIDVHNSRAEWLLKQAWRDMSQDPNVVFQYILGRFDNLGDWADELSARDFLLSKLVSNELIDGDEVKLVGQKLDSNGWLRSAMLPGERPEALRVTDLLVPGRDEAVGSVRSKWMRQLMGEQMGMLPDGVTIDPLLTHDRMPHRNRLTIARKDTPVWHELTTALSDIIAIRRSGELMQQLVGSDDMVKQLNRLLGEARSRKGVTTLAKLSVEEASAILKDWADSDPNFASWLDAAFGKKVKYGKELNAEGRLTLAGTSKQTRLNALAEVASALAKNGDIDVHTMARAMEEEAHALLKSSIWHDAFGMAEYVTDSVRNPNVWKSLDQVIGEANYLRRYVAEEVANVPDAVRQTLDRHGYRLVWGDSMTHLDDFKGIPADLPDQLATMSMGDRWSTALREWLVFKNERNAWKLRSINLRHNVAKELAKVKAANPDLAWLKVDPEGGHVERIVKSLEDGMTNLQRLRERARDAEVGSVVRVMDRATHSATPRRIDQLLRQQVRNALFHIDGTRLDTKAPTGKSLLDILGPKGADAVFKAVWESNWLGNWRVELANRSLLSLEDWLTTRKMSLGIFEVLSATSVRQALESGALKRNASTIAGAGLGALTGAAVDDENPMMGALTGGLLGAGVGKAAQVADVARVLPSMRQAPLLPGENFRTGGRIAGALMGGAAGGQVGALLPGEESPTLGTAVGALAGGLLGPAAFRGAALKKAGELPRGRLLTRVSEVMEKAPFRSASWGTYSPLSRRLVNESMRLRFSLSPIFDAQRYLEGAQLTMVDMDIPVDVKAQMPLFGRGKMQYIRRYGEDGWNEAYAGYKAAAGGRPLHDDYLDTTFGWVTEEGLFGFNPTHRQVTMFAELRKIGMSPEQAYRTAKKVYTYGAEGRSNAELAINFVFFPFSFQSRLTYRWGQYLADDTARALLIHDTLKLGEILWEEYDLADRWREHLPVLNTLRKLNAFSMGISPGELGGIHRPWLDAFIPVGMYVKDLAKNLPQGIEVATTEAGVRNTEAFSISDLASRLVPIVRDSKYLWDDLQSQKHVLFSGSHLTPWAEQREAWDKLRQYQQHLERVAVDAGFKTWDAYALTAAAQPHVDGYRSFRERLATEYPTWEESIGKVIEYRYLVNREVARRVANPKSALDRDLAEFVAYEQQIDRMAEAEGVDLDDIEHLSPRWFDLIRMKALSLQKRGNGFGALWDELYRRVYGPINTPVWRY